MRIHQSRHPDVTSRVRVTKIRAQVRNFGTTRLLRLEPTEGFATAQLEDSGKAQVEVSSVIQSRTIQLSLKASVQDLPLTELNPFFNVESGIELTGKILSAHSEMNVRGTKLHGWSKILYQGFHLKFRTMEDRSWIGTWFANLGSQLTIHPSSSSQNTASQTSLDRQHGESLVLFILRGIKESSKTVARQ